MHIVLAQIVLRSPVPTPSPSPSPSPSPRAAALREIAKVKSQGRRANLVGIALSASVGYIDREQILTRPLLRPGEILEAIPGLVISQHSGAGKANQYYLRGFQLDHGTDLESTIAGIPTNLPTHAHGQGYSDVNWLMPEIVSSVEFQKGTYYADQSDFATAGSYTLYFRDTIAPTAQFTVGSYGYDRVFLAGSPVVGAGHLLYAFEVAHDNGSFVNPDEYRKYDGVLRWSRTTPNTVLAITGIGYDGTFNSTDQIPLRLVDDGVLDRFGAIDPTDGGITSRVALSADLKRYVPNGVVDFTGYAFHQFLDLFSNFTYDFYDAADYYNVTANPITCNVLYSTCAPGPKHVSTYVSYCPANDAPTGAATKPQSVVPAPFAFACGDQREQQDNRFVSGFTASRTFVGNNGAQTTLGAGMRNDNIATVGLFLTNDRVRFANGTLSDDHVVERSANVWAQSEIRVGRKLRLIGGLRSDFYDFDVLAYLPQDSGRSANALVSPKFTAAYELDPHQELYANFGESFHSNDARAITQTVDPQTRAPYDASGQPVQQIIPLARATGEELGYRYSFPRLNSTISFWQLNLASELIFDGDHGTTSPSGPTVRKGIEFANFYTPAKWLTFDVDIATSSARFLNDPQGQGDYVPESLNLVEAIGATVDTPSYAASLRARYFGPRVLDQAGDAVSAPSLIFSGQFTKKLPRGGELRLDALNLFNAQVDDVEYYYASWTPHDAANPAYENNPAINPALGGQGINDYHFHPSQLRSFRLTYGVPM